MLFDKKLLIGSAILLFGLGRLVRVNCWEFISIKPVLAQTENTGLESSAKYFLNRGVNQAKKGDYGGAIEDFNQAIKLNPNFATYYNRGLVRHYSGDEIGAIEDFNQSIKLNPSFFSAYDNRGIIRYYLGDATAAIKDFSQAIKFNLNDADAYYNRGIVRDNLGDKSAALEDYRQAANLYKNQGKTDKYKEALNKLEKLRQ